MNAPLVSFCVKSYNQRRYLAEALEGAIAQTYRPLEIVVSDDGSTDGSWEFIQQFFAEHPAPEGVSIVLNRNERNLGNLGNWEKICSLAHGALLVKADGDDVSLPNRTAVIVERWLADGGKALVVCHTGWQIGPRGENYGKLRPVHATWPLGAAMTFSPILHRRFPPVPPEFWRSMDDETYTYRARMLGDILVLPDRLVYYRLGTGETSSLWRLRSCMRTCFRHLLETLDLAERDLVVIDAESQAYWRKIFAEERRQTALKLERLDSPSFARRKAIARELGWPPLVSFGRYIILALTLPKPIGDVLLLGFMVARNFYRRFLNGRP